MVEGAGGDDRDDSSGNKVAHPAKRTIRSCEDGRQRTEEWHTRLKVKADFFYADNGVVASNNLGWIQTTFDTLPGLFDRVGLKMNV